MKKTIFILSAMLVLAGSVNAQKKDINELAKSAALTVDKEYGFVKPNSKHIATLKPDSDTLEILKDCKFIKVNGKTIDVAMLNSALLIVSNKDVEAFLTGIQEYPAKIANPFTQYFLKFFCLTIAEPPKNAQK